MVNVLTFTLDREEFGIKLSEVTRVVWAVAITPLPHPDEKILGVINIQGQIIPVINLRKVLGLTQREMELSDQLIIGVLNERAFAILVDRVKDVASYETQDFIQGKEIFNNMDMLESVIKTKGRMILIFDWKFIFNEIISKNVAPAPACIQV